MRVWGSTWNKSLGTGMGKEGAQVVDGQPTGLILNHAYSLLGVFEIADPKDPTKPIRLMLLMNPWG